MNINKLFETLNFDNLKKGTLVLLSLAKDNQAEVLTGLAMAAIPAVVASTVKATRKADKAIEEAQSESEEELDLKTKTFVAGKYYIIPIALAVLSMGCTYASNYKSREKYAALAAVLAISETQNKDLIAQIEKLLGKEKKEEILEGMTMDRINDGNDTLLVPMSKSEKRAIDGSEEYDVIDYYGVKWKSSAYALERDWNTLQEIYLNDQAVFLYTWYELVGVKDKDIPGHACDVGWYDGWGTRYGGDLLIMKWDYVKDDKTGKPYIVLTYIDGPTSREQW